MNKRFFKVNKKGKLKWKNSIKIISKIDSYFKQEVLIFLLNFENNQGIQGVNKIISDNYLRKINCEVIEINFMVSKEKRKAGLKIL